MKIRTQSIALAAAIALTPVLLAPAGTAAQAPAPRTTVGWGVSVFSYSPFVEGAGREAELDGALGGTLYAHHWINPWIGLHVDGSWARPELTVPGQRAGVDIWTVSAGATLRPLGAPRPIGPYVVGSAGLISYGLGGPSLRLPEGGLVLETGKAEQVLFQAGAGVDVALMTVLDYNVIGLRAEVVNLMVTGRPFRVEGEGDPGSQSHLRFTVGLHTTLPRQ
jgi:hypothetical protein